VMALRAQGVRAIGFKPAQTGYEEGQESDADLLARASGDRTPLAAPLLQLDEALAPAVAAERAGLLIAATEIESRVELLRRDGYSLVIEGAGGVMVPLVWGYTVLDLAERFGLEAIVVGRAGLGTLNHVALTVAMLQLKHVSVRGIVLNGRTTTPDLAESTNPAALARMLPGIPIVEVPHHTGVGLIGSAVPLVRQLL
jgi:dethiobiotin synthetase